MSFTSSPSLSTTCVFAGMPAALTVKQPNSSTATTATAMFPLDEKLRCERIERIIELAAPGRPNAIFWSSLIDFARIFDAESSPIVGHLGLTDQAGNRRPNLTITTIE